MTPRTQSTQTEPTPTSTSTTALLTDRRGILLGTVAVAGAGALAACSSPPVAGEPAQASSGGQTPSPAGTPTAEIPVGGGKIFPDDQVVVTQPQSGQFKAFSAICTHQGCLVGQVEGGHIICPCHGSQFDITTGDPTPESLARSPLEAKTVTVTGSSFTVS